MRVYEDDNGVFLTTEDTGGGTTENTISWIFELFCTTRKIGKYGARIVC